MGVRTIMVGVVLVWGALVRDPWPRTTAEGKRAPSPAAIMDNGGMHTGQPADDGTAEERMRAARAAKAAIAGARDREQARRQAAALYVEVADAFPDAGALAAEALFRAGELLRANGDVADALAVLERATAVPRPGVFACRAWYEIGHIERRAGKLDAAAAAFVLASEATGGTRRRREQALLWRARCVAESGQREAAETLLRELVRRIEDPCDRLRAYDQLVLLLVEQGRLAGAVGFFAEAKRSVTDAAQQATELGDRVRRAIEDMRALDALRVAIRSQR